MPVTRPVAEVLVMPDLRDSAGGLVWPKICCCCAGPTGLDTIAIYGRTKFGGANTTFHVPYCRRCTSHNGRAGWRAGESFAKVFIIWFSVLSFTFLFGFLTDSLVAFLLQLLVVFGSVVWAVRTYFLARVELEMESPRRVRAPRPQRSSLQVNSLTAGDSVFTTASTPNSSPRRMSALR